MRRLLGLSPTAVLLLAGPAPVVAALPVTLVEGGFSQPLFVTHAGDSRFFAVEKVGLIKIVGDGTFLDISTEFSVENERGLLGLAFAPRYASNGLFYVNYLLEYGHIVSGDDNSAVTGGYVSRRPGGAGWRLVVVLPEVLA